MTPTLTASAQGGFRFISLFSGIDAASVAWVPMGAECVAVAEVDKAACAVLKHRYPNVPNLGDVTTITEERIRALGHIDVVVFGSPCQDLSIAGKRSGLEGERSGLFFVAMRIVRWSGARWAVFENVPGLFSSNAGLDFAAVVREMVGVQPDVPPCGWCNSGVFAGPDGLLEWATLDGQFFGVPQRRRRIFAVRDIGDWRSRPPILLECDSLSGHPAPSREARQVAPTIPARSLGGGGLGTDFDCDGGLVESAKSWPAEVAPAINAHYGDKQGLEDQHIRGGAGLFVYGRDSALPERGGDGAAGLRDGDPAGGRGFL